MAGECQWRAQHKTYRGVTPAGEPTLIRWVRFVCDYGKATQWYRDEHRASEARDRHAVNGQQSLL